MAPRNPQKQRSGLVRLEYGRPYCEVCRDRLQPGWLVAWEPIRDRRGRTRMTVICADCHRGRRRALARDYVAGEAAGRSTP
jgi:RNase P subunit RPR2